MKDSLMEIIRCPSCTGDLAIENELSNDIEIRSATLICKTCHKEYDVEKGIPLLINVQDKLLQDELDGWVQMAKNEGWYDVTDEYMLSLPRPERSPEGFNWKRHADNFDFIVSQLDLEGKTVLDIGAGRCWSSRILASKGANVIAIDALADSMTGLGAADIFIRDSGVLFDRVCGDMIQLPIKTNSVDGIVFSGALHHSNDLNGAIVECARVLKRPGFLALAQEPSTGFLGRESIGKPTKLGINEHNYRYARYRKCFKEAGFKTTEFPEKALYEGLSDMSATKVLDFIRKSLKGGILTSVSVIE